MHWYVRSLSCKPNIYASWCTSELRVRLAPLNRFKPSSKIFYWPFQGGTSFVGSLMFFFCLVFSMSLCAFIYMCFVVTCWERADLLALVCGVLLWVCHFPIVILGQVWYLIVSIPDLCTLTYFSSIQFSSDSLKIRQDRYLGVTCFHENIKSN